MPADGIVSIAYKNSAETWIIASAFEHGRLLQGYHVYV